MQCSCGVNNWREDEEQIGYKERKLKAAKDHICPECHGTIKKGDYFIFASIFWDAKISNNKMCMDCAAIANEFFPDGWVFGQIFDDLYYYFEEHWVNDLPSNCLSKLPPGARDYVCDMLQEFQES